MTPDPMIESSGLTKRFGETVALAGLDLAAARGTVLGVLGPNGAGKTTAVRILTTLAVPDGGAAHVAGFDVVREPAQVQRRIGVTGQDATLDELLTGRQNLVDDRPPGRPRPASGACPGRGAARPVRAERRRRPDDEDLLGRDAPAPRSGRRCPHPPAGSVSRRADHRPGSDQPGPHVGGDPPAGGRRHDAPAHDSIPRRGRRAGRPDRGDRPRSGHRRGNASAS